MIKPKPDEVKIINHSIAIMETKLAGGLSMLITGLGDDGLIYKYDGKKHTWSIEVDDE